MSRILRLSVGIWMGLVMLGYAESYTLSDLLQLAEKNNKQIQLARADLKTASAERLGAFAQAFPKISINAGYNRNLQENLFFFEAPDPLTGQLVKQSFKASFRNEFSMSAVLRQTLFSYEVGMAIQAAHYFDQMTRLIYERTLQEVHVQVKTAFYGALLAREVYNVARDSEESARENYENLKYKYDAGAISEFELLQAEVRWQSSIPQTYRAEQEYHTALNNLKVLVGLPVVEPVQLVGTLQGFPKLQNRSLPKRRKQLVQITMLCFGKENCAKKMCRPKRRIFSLRWKDSSLTLIRHRLMNLNLTKKTTISFLG